MSLNPLFPLFDRRDSRIGDSGPIPGSLPRNPLFPLSTVSSLFLNSCLALSLCRSVASSLARARYLSPARSLIGDRGGKSGCCSKHPAPQITKQHGTRIITTPCDLRCAVTIKGFKPAPEGFFRAENTQHPNTPPQGALSSVPRRPRWPNDHRMITG